MATAVQIAAARKKNIQPGYDIVVTTAFELIGVGAMALLAGINDDMGNIVIIVMVGFLIGWAIANSGVLTKYLGKGPPMAPEFAPFIK